MVAASGVAVTTAATETKREEMVVVATGEAEPMESAETEEHVERILLAIESFTRQFHLLTFSSPFSVLLNL